MRNPHLRLTFFRTINLFSKFGAFPLFVIDGMPSHLKSQARILRFIRASGMDVSCFPAVEEGVSIERNRAFLKCIRECVELLELLGMPVLKAKGEAEALCAQLNREGHVDACITADSDAFLFGAQCVVKHIRPNCKEPLECYHMSDIEAGLGLKRKHLIAISLLVGNDHDLNGVQGVGLDTALRFVKSFNEDEILTRLSEIGRGDALQLQGGMGSIIDSLPVLEDSPKKRTPHCSLCGHPGTKKAHFKLSCEFCISVPGEGCLQKPVGYRCNCTFCDLDRREKEHKKNENWQIKVCQKIAMEQNFPNVEIVDMYLGDNHYDFSDDGPQLAWGTPNTEMLVDYLAFHQRWEPSYIRQRMLPMLSTTFLREMASDVSKNNLLYGQYEFDSIQRVKTRYGHQRFLVNWKKASHSTDKFTYAVPIEESNKQAEPIELDETNDPQDGDEAPQISVNNGCWFLTTDESMDLVKAAFPEKTDQFSKEKELKELKSRRKKSSSEPGGSAQNSESPTTRRVQLSITEFYRSSKVVVLRRQKRV
ncbi:Spleen exonuclease [Bertholletia excelsa]